MNKRMNGRIKNLLIVAIVVFSTIAMAPLTMAISEVTATRDISTQTVKPGETFTVTVMITANQDIYAPILDENPPSGWTVTPIQNDGAVFKESEIKWLWLEMLSTGTSKTVIYNITVPSYAEVGTYYIIGNISTYQVGPIDVGGENGISAISEPALVFDTGSPVNPYPSISGTHIGTIIPNQTIIVCKLYTYPCVGTGGHTEYAKIWNATWNATATWKGYIGDWHNITFDKPFTLYADTTYNYTIRTGSYPKIIHVQEFNATGGKITCTEFVDVNGVKHNDWIPAIRLE
jgi:hypothetical protein